MDTTQSPCVGPLDLQISCLCDSASTSPALPGHQITIKEVQDHYLQSRNNAAFNKVENSGPVSAAFIISDNCKPFVLQPGRIDYSSSKKRVQEEQPQQDSKPAKAFRPTVKLPRFKETSKKRDWHSSMVDEIAAAGSILIEGLQDDSSSNSPDVASGTHMYRGGYVPAPKPNERAGPVTRSQVPVSSSGRAISSSSTNSFRTTPVVRIEPQPAFTSSPDLSGAGDDVEEGLLYLKKALQHSEQVLDATKRQGAEKSKSTVTGQVLDQSRSVLSNKSIHIPHADPPRAPLGNVMNRVNVNSVYRVNSLERTTQDRKMATEKICHTETHHQIAGLQDFGGELVADASRASLSESGPAPSGAKPRKKKGSRPSVEPGNTSPNKRRCVRSVSTLAQEHIVGGTLYINCEAGPLETAPTNNNGSSKFSIVELAHVGVQATPTVQIVDIQSNRARHAPQPQLPRATRSRATAVSDRFSKMDSSTDFEGFRIRC